MQPRSLGYRTDLMLRRLAGSEVVDRGDHIVVRTNDNPTFYWGNFLLLSEAPAAAESARWLAAFAAEFPAAEHISMGVDVTQDRDIARLEGFAGAADLTAEVSTVLTATAADLRQPAKPNRQAELRELRTDADWQQAAELQSTVDEEADSPAHRTFLLRRMEETRRLTEAGHGAWFGAFIDGHMRSGLGLFTDGSGLARFQTVETHPDFERQGLAGTLVHHAGRYGIDHLKAQQLVILADPDYVAIRVYRSVGFEDVEQQVQLLRRPPPD